MVARVITLVLFAATLVLPSAEPVETISGTVVDEYGDPVPRAVASAVGPIGRPSAKVIPRVETDDHGHFTIPVSDSGEYFVSAGKEEEGYPEKWLPFNAGFDRKYVVRVRVTEANPEANVTIPLGPKGGVLIGTVRDAATGAPINPCAEFRRVAEPKNFMSGTGLINATFHRLVPSDVSFTLKVWVDGHKPWYYPGVEQPANGKPLKLGPGEEAHFDIALEPDATRKDTGCGMPVGTVIRP